MVRKLHSWGGGERELGGDGAAVEVLERHRRDGLLLRHGRSRRGGRRGPPAPEDERLLLLLSARLIGVQRVSVVLPKDSRKGKGLCRPALDGKRLGNFTAWTLRYLMRYISRDTRGHFI